jgi:hypothetical protein
MQSNFDLDNFIKTFVTKREESLLKPDFTKYQSELGNRINGKKYCSLGVQPLERELE